MNKKITALCVGTALTMLPAAGFSAGISTIEDIKNIVHPGVITGKKMELYGAVRVSVDYADSDVSSAEAEGGDLLTDGGLSVSSNTSMIGFRGEVPYNDKVIFLWQYEQQVDIDDKDEGDTWTTRDSFLGLKTPVGRFLVGRVNTPFKNMSTEYALYFASSVGESRSILGAPSSGAGAHVDLMGANSLNWRFQYRRVNFALQYSADQSGSVNAVDDNDRDSTSAWLDWKGEHLQLSGAYIHYSDFFATGKLEGYRAFAKYTMGPVTLGAIYEDLQPEQFDTLDREAYGAQVTYRYLPRWVLVGQWNHADESERGDDAADQYSLGLFHHLSKQVLLHGMLTHTDNDGQGTYRAVNYAHGDKVATLPGRDPWAISVGAQLRF
ncbi:Porin precursor [Alloalcanivorax xenomutans]|uniref:porin n=1 Tax=Alloalcanivorax xenomutans TaxID=1094342 RepID=UPI0006D5BDA1|nr:porin [Alloalcanivorax xenomutans]PHS67412.1 MAG: porin [Alcanivorax sp.]CUR44649.1 Porin precursor [Alloalcanivorax xenomutans]